MTTHVFSDTGVMLGRSVRHVTRSMDTIITVTIMPIAVPGAALSLPSSLGPAADVSGVGGPVACGCLLPLDGDLDVHAEHPGEDRGGQFGGEGEQRGGSVLPGLQADLLEALAEPVVGEGQSGAAAGEQPRHVVRGADPGLAAAGRDEVADQAGQWLGEDDRRAAEPDRDCVVAEVDVVDGELADGGDALGVEDQQQPSDPVGGRERVVVPASRGSWPLR